MTFSCNNRKSPLEQNLILNIAQPYLLDRKRNSDLISSYGAPLTQRASYLALHSSLFGPVAQLIMIMLSVTALVNWLKMYSQWRTH